MGSVIRLILAMQVVTASEILLERKKETTAFFIVERASVKLHWCWCFTLTVLFSRAALIGLTAIAVKFMIKIFT